MDGQTKTTSPFLAGMRATGREGFDAAGRREYKNGFRAIPDMICALERMEALMHIGADSKTAGALMAEVMREIETTWSRIKAAIDGEWKS